jgi:ketosteroid isomerase-like protein
MRILAALALCIASLVAPAHAQQQQRPAPPPTNPEFLKQLDQDIWKPFVAAFAAGKPEDYFALHSSAFVRAMGDAKRVEPREAWLKGTRGMFKHFSERNIKPAISFRFLERLSNGEAASERGIFEFTTTDAKGESRRAYGKFHVISRKEDGRWKILVDYDSNEKGTITRETFMAAHAPDDYAKY